MVCIQCGGKTVVKNSRSLATGTTTWRRRQCLQCHSILTTRESFDYEAAWRIRNSGKSSTAKSPLQPFWRDKLLMSLVSSLSHRNTALSDATQLTETIIAQLAGIQQHGVIEKSAITGTAVAVLGRFDPVAAVHYKAHHPL